VTNEDVLKKVSESRNMLNAIRQQKGRWICPVKTPLASARNFRRTIRKL